MGTMRKIASPQDLQTELQRLLAYTQGPDRPSRERLASELRGLADRVAATKFRKGDRVKPAPNTKSKRLKEMKGAVGEIVDGPHGKKWGVAWETPPDDFTRGGFVNMDVHEDDLAKA